MTSSNPTPRLSPPVPKLPGPGEAPRRGPLKLLCLEDNLRDRELTAERLRAEGLECEIVFAKTEEEFQVALKRADLDLIISDFTLPSYDGMSALALVQSTRPEVPFLFVSGTLGEERAVESLKSGATDYILKDNLHRLGPAVRRALVEAAERARRREAEAALKESEARFRQVAESIDLVFWLTNTTTGEILYISPAGERIWGRDCEELRRNPGGWLEMVHPADHPRVQAALDRQGQGRIRDTYRIVRPDGSIRWICDSIYPIRNESGEIYRLVGIADDVTERRALEEQLRQAQKMEGIGQLAGGVAHDFNNLLTVIRGNTELVLMGAEGLGDENRDLLKQVTAASERAADLTRQLLAFGRKQTLQTQPLDLAQVIGNLARMLTRIIGEDIRLKCSHGASLPRVQADIGMLEQVIVNLVVNSRDAMPRGGELLLTTDQVVLDDTHTRARPEARAGRFVCLSVTDTGTGIAAEHLSHVFEPFFTTKEAGKGTGLGLAIVYGIVKQHHGWIEVSSRLGAGTTFQIFLPAIAAPSAAPAAPAPEPALRGGTERILLVEDDAAVRLLTRRTLEAFGYRIWEAAAGREALEIWRARAGRIDLLLTDIIMPDGVTGRELAALLRAQSPALKVIFVSGYNPDVSGRDMDSGPGGTTFFLQKPHPIRVLLDTVRRCLEA